MSAGGLSYSGLINHGKITLPSVESWGQNNSLLKDPPKSLYTRKIDKVGQTSSITQTIEESSDRACEAIQVYARGVNPCVSVSYSNNGSNGGQSISSISTGTAAKLPYTIMRDGAFRPPILLQQDLLPLSRLPRNLTHFKPNKGFVDFSKKLRSCGTAEETKEVKNNLLNVQAKPTAIYKIEKPVTETYDVKNLIQPTINRSVNSGQRTMDITQQHVGNPTKEIDSNPLHARAQANYVGDKQINGNHNMNSDRFIQDANSHYVVSNVSDNSSYVNNNNKETGRYVQDINNQKVMTNICSNKRNTTLINELVGLGDVPVHENIIQVQANAPYSGTDRTKYIHEDISLERSLPEYTASTNIGDTSVYKRVQHENELNFQRNVPLNSFVSNPVARGNSEPGSKEKTLAPKLQAGSFHLPPSIPMSERMENGITSGNSEKARINKFVTNSMQDRFGSNPPFK